MRLSYRELIRLIEDGVIDADPANVNGASIDVRLGKEIKLERDKRDVGFVDLRDCKNVGVDFYTLDITHGVLIQPGQFFLAHTVETFNLPNTICADFRLRSSIARCGLNALLANWCLVGDTEIPLLDGSIAKIKDLEGKQVWCYSVNVEGKTVPGFASRVWKTKQTRSTIKITLDDLSEIECTEDHLFMKRDGSWVKACDVIAGMPMASVPRKKRCANGVYESVYSASGYRRSWVSTHAMVDAYFNGKLPRGYVVHHADHNPENNDPSNLVRMKMSDHVKHHIETMDADRAENLRKTRSENAIIENEIRWSSQENRDRASVWAKSNDVVRHLRNFISDNKDAWYRKTLLGNVKKTVDVLTRSGFAVTPDNYTSFKRQNAPTVSKLSDVFGSFHRAVEESGYSNHVVLSVERAEYAEPIDVYDMTVDEHHNFVVGTGIVSHNCDPGWNGAQLTLELHNVCQHHSLLVTEGLKVGQMIFDRVEAVPEDRSYATVGRYNLQSGATESLGAC